MTELPITRSAAGLPSIVYSPLLNDPRGRDVVRVPSDSPTSAGHPTKVKLTDEQGMARALKLGALVGIPSVFLVTGGIGVLGGAGLGVSVLIGLWCGLFGGGLYLGGLFFLPGHEETDTRPPRQPSAAALREAAQERTANLATRRLG